MPLTSTVQKPQSATWVVLCLFGGLTLLLLGMKLGFGSVEGITETDFALIKVATTVSTSDLHPLDLVVSDASSVELPNGETYSGTDLTLRVVASRARIPALNIASGSTLELAVERDEGRLRLVLDVKDISFDVIPQEDSPLEIRDAAKCSNQACTPEYKGPKPIRVKGGSSPVTLFMNLEKDISPLADRIAAAKLQLWQVDRIDGRIEQRGSLSGGSIRFLDVPQGITYLDRGTILDIEPDNLVLRALQIKGGDVSFQFSGTVSNIAIGVGNVQQSLMPTLFDWLSGAPRVRVGLGILTLLVGGGLAWVQGLVKRIHQISPAPFKVSPPAEDESALSETECQDTVDHKGANDAKNDGDLLPARSGIDPRGEQK